MLASLPGFSSRWCCTTSLPAAASPRRPGQSAALPRRPCQMLPDGSLQRPCQSALVSRPVSSSATAPTGSCFPMALCHVPASLHWRPGRSAVLPWCPGQQLRYGALASNKPHPAEKSTPVWLAIWRTWAGFANSQLLRAAFCSIYLNIGTHLPCCHLGAAAQTEQIYRPICTDWLRHLRISAE